MTEETEDFGDAGDDVQAALQSLQGQIAALTAVCGILARAVAASTDIDLDELGDGIGDVIGLTAEKHRKDAERVVDVVQTILRHGAGP